MLTWFESEQSGTEVSIESAPGALAAILIMHNVN